jgi:hypothetical protein
MDARYPPTEDRAFTAHAGLWLGLVLLLAGIAILGVWQSPERINHDCALYLQQSEMLLDGAVPYCDFADTNPPLILYLNVVPVALARTFGVPVIPIFQCLVVALVVLSGIEIYFLLKKPRMGLAPQGRGLVLLAWLALYFVVDLHGDAGQREHLFVLLYVPYLFLRILRHRDGSIAGWLALLLGVQAGIGAALKPHFLLEASGVEIALLLISRRWRTLARPENYAVVAVIAAYAVHWLFVPAAMREAFFCRWLPLVRRGYDAYNVPYFEAADTLISSPISLAALGGALLAALRCTRRRWPLRHHLTALATLAGMALAMIFLQSKGWSYHRIPYEVAGLLCLTILGASGRVPLLAGKECEGSGLRLPPLAGKQWHTARFRALHCSAAILLGFLLVLWFNNRGNARPDPPEFDALRQLIQEQTEPGDRVLVIATSIRPAYPMLLQIERKPGSRYLCAFPLACLYAGAKPANTGRPIYRRRREAPAEEKQFLDELQDDVSRLRPRLVLIPNSPSWLGLSEGFNTFDYLVYSGWTKEALRSYRELASPEGWKVFGLAENGQTGQAAILPTLSIPTQ